MNLSAEAPMRAGLPSEPPAHGMSLAWPHYLARMGAMWAVKDADSGRYLHACPAMLKFLGRELSALRALTDADLFDAPVAVALRAADQTAMAQTGQGLVSNHRFEFGGARREYQVFRLAMNELDKRLLCLVWDDQAPRLQREVQLKAALEQLELQQRANDALRRELKDQALRDSATGLYRASHFEEQLRREIDLSSREHREFAVVLIHVDAAPQSSSVAAGEGEEPALIAGSKEARAKVHESLGRLLRSNTRAMDVSARLDQDRFAVLLSGVGLATAHSRMEGLRRQCAAQIVPHEGRELAFSVSMGVASFPHTAASQDELVAACEQALAEAQRRGGNRLTLASIRFEPPAA